MIEGQFPFLPNFSLKNGPFCSMNYFLARPEENIWFIWIQLCIATSNLAVNENYWLFNESFSSWNCQAWTEDERFSFFFFLVAIFQDAKKNDLFPGFILWMYSVSTNNVSLISYVRESWLVCQIHIARHSITEWCIIGNANGVLVIKEYFSMSSQH